MKPNAATGGVAVPLDYEIVRATGLCCVCDFRFTHELVARIRSRSLPGGWAYIELRHLREDPRWDQSRPHDSNLGASDG
jgi:hypothetical protein